MSKTRSTFLLVAIVAATANVSRAQDPKAAVQAKLLADYKMTQATADNTDIVTAGSILVLKKSNLLLPAITGSDVYQNTYKNGKISQNGIGKGLVGWKSIKLPGVSSSSAPSSRTFVSGEKIWATAILVKDDCILFNLYSDPYSDVRFKGSLKFPFSRGSVPSPEQAEQTVAEVFDIQPAEDTKTDAQKPAAGSAPPAAAPSAPAMVAEAPPAPIAPPPPPADQPPAPPKTIAVGQTTAQVIADWGQPLKIITKTKTQTYVYSDMKVTFANGKVTDIQ